MSAALTSPLQRAWLQSGGGRFDLLVAGAALLLLLAWDVSGLDLATARLFGSADGFAWRDRFLTSRVMHDGGRWLGFAVLALMVVNVWRPLWPGLSRRQRLIGLGSTVLCLLAIPALKQFSPTSCPWDLSEFGGVAQHVSHWRFGVPDGGPGRCFPSGHAIAAFAFFGGYFMLRQRHPRAAGLWLAGVLLLGAAFGAAQLARGAHYPSHTLWSAWLCWVLSALCAAAGSRATGAPAR
jgi:membrane-associated PAP2 superfamily phosphatase